MALVRDTSVDAFNDVKRTNLGARQRTILDVLGYMGSATNLEISRYIGLPINQVTPRTNELVKKRFVVQDGKRICKVSGKLVYTWRVNYSGK